MTTLSRPLLQWRRLKQKLWFRPAVWSLIAVAATITSYTADSWFPERWVPKMDAGVVPNLLRILATSMLAVSTFALSVLVQAFASAANAGTPRATRLVVAEPRAQSAVGVFLASFNFAIIGVIAVGIGTWGPSALFALFLCAVAVIFRVIYAFLEYLQVLTRIGMVAHTIKTVEQATRSALIARAESPLGGANPAEHAPAGALGLLADELGYVQLVDVTALQKACEEFQVRAHVEVRTGDFVHPRSKLLSVSGVDALSKELVAALRRAFILGGARTVEQDGAYGLIVLGEVALRALSPAVNDPGTAIAVIASQTRLLLESLARPTSPERDRHPLVSAAPVDPGIAIHLAYEPVTRAGAAVLEVQQQLLHHLEALACNTPEPAAARAREQAARCIERARDGAMQPRDFAVLEAAYARAFRS
ncbi:MAG: DUF2254 domain-containing protein [Planctomycetota bacterium]